MADPKDQQKRMVAEALRMLGEEYESNDGFMYISMARSR
jgi:hypothetical protein